MQIPFVFRTAIWGAGLESIPKPIAAAKNTFGSAAEHGYGFMSLGANPSVCHEQQPSVKYPRVFIHFTRKLRWKEVWRHQKCFQNHLLSTIY